MIRSTITNRSTGINRKDLPEFISILKDDFNYMSNTIAESFANTLTDLAIKCDTRGLSSTAYGKLDEKTAMFGLFHCVEESDGKVAISYVTQTLSAKNTLLQQIPKPDIRAATEELRIMGVANLILVDSTQGKMGQSWSKTNWAELIQTHADQKVKSKNHSNATAKHLLTYGNNPKTRVMVLSLNKENDEKLLNDVIKNSAQKKADLVEYSVVSVKDYIETTTNGNQFKKVEFLEKVKTVYRPTMFVMNKKNQEVLNAYQALVGDRKIDEELTESDDGYVFYQSLDIVVPESEPVIRTFSVKSTGRGVKEYLTKLLEENKASIPNDANTRVLVISGSHEDRRKVKGKIDPVGGESGLSDEFYLNNLFYRQDCQSIGIQANASHFDEDYNGDFDKWKTPSFTRPDIRTVTPCNPLPPDSLLSDPDFDKIHFQVIDVENYHNRPELRGNVTKSPAAAVKRCEELVRDVVAYQPTVIFVAWCFSCNGDIALALRAEGVFSELIVEHELRSITGDPHAKLDTCQKDVLWEMCQDSVKHVVLAGPAGVGKTVVGCEGAKQEAAKLKKEHPEATVEIYVVSWAAGSASEELYKVFSKKHFEGLSAFPMKYRTRFQLCEELGLDIKNCGADKSIDFILEVCNAKDKVNKEQEKKGGGQQFTVLMVDEAMVKPTGDEKVQDWTELGQLESLSTVRTITCAQPSAGAVAGAQYNVKLPGSSDARHQPTSFCTRLLNVGYRNSPAIRRFNNFFVDHVPGMTYLARGSEFKVGTHAPSSPAGAKGVEWIQCSRTEDLGRAARKAVEDCGSDDTVVLYIDREGEDVSKVAAEASTAHSVVDWGAYAGCEATKIIVVSNYGIHTEATTRAREKLVMVTGPGLYSRNNHLLSEAAASGHVYKRFDEVVRCGEDPCGWSGGCLVGEFPLLEHKMFCPTQGCGMFGARDGKCPKCGWELEWSRLRHMSLNGQLLAYVGEQTFLQSLAKSFRWFGPGRKGNVGLAQAKSPLATGSHYFEIEIIDGGSNREIAIGLAGKDYPKDNLPGWREGSIGYHADDGKIFVGRGVGDPFGPLCKKGDVMGCGIRFPRDNKSKEEQGASVAASKDCDNKSGEDEVEQEVNTHHEGKVQVYFTRNGEIAGFKKALVPEGGFFPTVGMTSYGAKVKVDLKPDCGPVFDEEGN